MIELLHGDCLELMKNISDKSIDLILCDLPYGQIQKNSNKMGKDATYARPSTVGKEWFQEFTNYPDTVLNFKKPIKPVHPTQKPVELLEYLIKTYTKENALVLDNTMGSCSTGVACINTNRNFIGIEKDNHYFEVAKERIKQAEKDNAQLLFKDGA